MEHIYEVEIENGSKIKHVFELHKGSRVKINGVRTYTLIESAILIVDVPDFTKMRRDPRIKAMVAAYKRSQRVTNDKT
jgi:hypothetical protein